MTVFIAIMGKGVIDQLSLEHKAQGTLGALVDPSRWPMHLHVQQELVWPGKLLVTDWTRDNSAVTVAVTGRKLVFQK